MSVKTGMQVSVVELLPPCGYSPNRAATVTSLRMGRCARTRNSRTGIESWSHPLCCLDARKDTRTGPAETCGEVVRTLCEPSARKGARTFAATAAIDVSACFLLGSIL